MSETKESVEIEADVQTPAVQPVAVAASRLDIETLIAKAIDKDLSADTMERFLSMRRELKAEQAKYEFDRALSEFQAECPTIEKTKKVDFTSKRTGNKVAYSYAPLEVIVQQVKDRLSKYGFSYTVNTRTNGMVTAICKLTHEAGHSESSEFSVPIDPDAFMNEQQKYASALTFAKRYAFCNALGILTGDEDNDALDASEIKEAQPTRPSTIAPSEKQMGMIQSLAKQKGYTPADFKEWGFTTLTGGKEGTASKLIDSLLKAPTKAQELPVIEQEAPLPDDYAGIAAEAMKRDFASLSNPNGQMPF